MKEQQNIHIVKTAYEAFGRGDIPGVLASLSQDVVWTLPGAPEIPVAGEFRGRAGVGDFFRLLAENEDIERFEPREFFAGGDRVVVLGHYRARVRATGGTHDFEWVHVFTIRDGLLATFCEFYDTLVAAAAYRSLTPSPTY